MPAMQENTANGNGHVRINLNIPEKLNDLLLRVMATEQLKGRRLNRHKLFKETLIDYARRRRIPIPKGL